MAIEMILNARFQASDVMHFRGRVRQHELAEVMAKLEKHLTLNRAKRSETSIVAIHTLYLESKIMDVEVFVPVTKAVPDSEAFGYMPVFELRDCLLVKCEDDDNLSFIPYLFTEIYRRALKMGIEIGQPLYIVSENCPADVLGLVVFDVEVYVGV